MLLKNQANKDHDRHSFRAPANFRAPEEIGKYH